MVVLQTVLLTVCLIAVAVPSARWFKRRAAFRDFAARHQLRFVGVLPSDKRAPYIYFEHVKGAVLLYHVSEGLWEGFEVALFDYRASRNTTWTAVILTLPNDVTPFRLEPTTSFHSARASLGNLLGGWERVTPAHPSLAAATVMTAENAESAAAALGAHSGALLASRPDVVVETHFSFLRVTPRRQVGPHELEDLLRFAAQLARALMADAGTTREGGWSVP